LTDSTPPSEQEEGTIDPLTLPDSLAERNAPLPLPIRGTRYAVGALLLLVILTVVLATYRRIEQQLQLTLESRLTAVLNENVHSVTGWLHDRSSLAQRIATLDMVHEKLSELRTGGNGHQKTTGDRAFFPLVQTGLIDNLYLLRPDGETAWSLGPAPPLMVEPIHLTELENEGKAVFLDRQGTDRRIVSLALIGPKKSPEAILALTIEARAMTRGLQAAQRQQSGESYAFDALGAFGTPTVPKGEALQQSAFVIPPQAKESILI
jgi:hypothetical protein